MEAMFQIVAKGKPVNFAVLATAQFIVKEDPANHGFPDGETRPSTPTETVSPFN